MNVRLIVFVAALCWSVELHGQTQPSANIPFYGCYESVSQMWHPGNEDASSIRVDSNSAVTKPLIAETQGRDTSESAVRIAVIMHANACTVAISDAYHA